jgi:hypothetical protein
MGACFDGVSVRSDNERDAVALCYQAIKDSQWENGHGGYSGTLAEANGAEIDRSQVFTSFGDAEEYLEDVAQKWGPAVGVRVEIDDRVSYFFGAWCSS